MKTLKFLAPLFISGLLVAGAASAGTFGTAVGGGLGAVAGVVIGDSMGGRNGAIIGSGIGGAVGAVVGQSVSSPPRVYQPTYGGGGYAVGYAPVYQRHVDHYYYEVRKPSHGHSHGRGHYDEHRHGGHGRHGHSDHYRH
jgi:hypothetical protein